MNWRSANGKLKEMSCRNALCLLERQGRVRFAESKKRFSFQTRTIPRDRKGIKAVGLVVHDTMAFTEKGTPLGLLDVQCWARDPRDRGKKERRKQTAIEDKESIKWLKSYRRASEGLLRAGHRKAGVAVNFQHPVSHAGNDEVGTQDVDDGPFV